MSRIVTLDPYTKQVTVTNGEHTTICSYQEAVSTPSFAAALSPAIVATINASLEAAQ